MRDSDDDIALLYRYGSSLQASEIAACGWCPLSALVGDEHVEPLRWQGWPQNFTSVRLPITQMAVATSTTTGTAPVSGAAAAAAGGVLGGGRGGGDIQPNSNHQNNDVGTGKAGVDRTRSRRCADSAPDKEDQPVVPASEEYRSADYGIRRKFQLWGLTLGMVNDWLAHCKLRSTRIELFPEDGVYRPGDDNADGDCDGNDRPKASL